MSASSGSAALRLAVLMACLAAVTVRLAVQIMMPQPVLSDSQAYLAMAQSFADGLPMRDNFGQAAFYSPGYPLLLGAVFMLFGVSVKAALAINLILAAITAWLIAVLANRLTRDGRIALIAVLGFAVWLPSLLSAATLAKENLSVPLMLGFVVAVIDVVRGNRPRIAAAAGGLCFGTGLLAGASSLLTVAAFVVALIITGWRRSIRHAAGPAFAFTAAMLLCLGPWLAHTYHLFGHPVLTTNSGFNLYLGNNPAATGEFVSIADTPVGPRWNELRAERGEAESAALLGEAARAYAASHPERTVTLAAYKLARFWAPNVPDAADRVSGVMAAVRWIDVVQHVAIVALALIGWWRWRRSPAASIMASVIIAFWVVHSATYVMVRYREPVMPMMIVLAAAGLWLVFNPKARTA